MINLKTVFESGLPLSPMYLVNTLRNLCHKVVIEQSVLNDIALMASGSDITSLLSVNDLIEIARCIKSRGTVFLENDTEPTLCGGVCTPVETWTLCNEGTDVSILIAWINKSGSSVIYHRLEMHVNYSTNKTILDDAFYKSL